MRKKRMVRIVAVAMVMCFVLAGCKQAGLPESARKVLLEAESLADSYLDGSAGSLVTYSELKTLEGELAVIDERDGNKDNEVELKQAAFYLASLCAAAIMDDATDAKKYRDEIKELLAK